tara:strand:- start:294 stop:545 length:252 start_codon:yes stop_codon:yes gene_type:complete
MTTTEEAKHLLDRFKSVTRVFGKTSTIIHIHPEHALQCALTNLNDKIISIHKFKHPTNSSAMNRRVDREIKRLEEVKQEINKL